MADAEKHFSSLVASRLGIPLTLRASDDACYDPRWHDRELRTPEPNFAIVCADPQRTIAAEMAEQAKVWFFGEGPDNALVFEWQPYLRWLFKRMDWSHLSGAVVQYLLSKQAREWRSTVSNCIEHRPAGERKLPFEWPQWLDGVLSRSTSSSRERVSYGIAKQAPLAPRAIASFTSPRWQYFLEQFDPSVSGTPLAWRHPILTLEF